MTNNYREQIEFLTSQFEEIDGYDFYRFIFPNNENQGEFNADFSKPNAIYLYQDEKDKGTKRRLRRRIMLNDTWGDDYASYVIGNPSTLCSGLAYRNRTNKIVNAQSMNALVFDLDGVGLKELRNLFLRFDNDPKIMRTLPMPTFLVSSGSGIHVYYVFNESIDLYPNIKIQLKTLKHELTFRMWEYKATSQEKAIQYQSINQGFRMVGSVNVKHGVEIRAFQIGERVSLDYMNQYVREPFRVDINKPFRPSQMTKDEAKEAYPEWYQRVVVEKNKKHKKWDIKSKQGYALYEWWLRQADDIRGGHRYFFLMCMAIYACKCDVPMKKLKEDMYRMFDKLQDIEHGNPLTEYDIESALEAYDKEYFNFTIADIEKLTDVRIERNKRNHRKQEEHLLRARTVQQLDYPNGEWRGDTSKEQLVKDYIKDHPTENPTQIANVLKISRPTVYKYLNRQEMALLKPKEQMEIAGQIVEIVVKIAKAKNISEEMAYKEYVNFIRNYKSSKPFVIEDDPDMFSKMNEYVSQGFRSVNIISAAEYDQMIIESILSKLEIENKGGEIKED